jgi:putative transcriptional regulator
MLIVSRFKIANKIRRLRFERDEMTQQELARLAGCTRQTIIALEQGKYVPSLVLAFRIASSLGAPLEEVFQLEPVELGKELPAFGFDS